MRREKYAALGLKNPPDFLKLQVTTNFPFLYFKVLKGTLPQNIFILKSGNLNSFKIGGLTSYFLKFFRNDSYSYFKVPKTMSPLNVQGKVCMAPFHVQSKVCIAPIQGAEQICRLRSAHSREQCRLCSAHVREQ